MHLIGKRIVKTMSDAELVILGWFLGIIGGLVLPELQSHIKERRAMGHFKKQVRLEIKNLSDLIMSEINTFEDYYEINSSSSESDLIDSMLNKNFPLNLGRNYRCDVFRSNWKYLVLLDQTIQEKINKCYIRVDTLNSIPSMYEKVQDSSQGVKNEMIIFYYNGLNLALEKAQEVLSELEN
jgi:hypothetical protein